MSNCYARFTLYVHSPERILLRRHSPDEKMIGDRKLREIGRTCRVLGPVGEEQQAGRLLQQLLQLGLRRRLISLRLHGGNVAHSHRDSIISWFRHRKYHWKFAASRSGSVIRPTEASSWTAADRGGGGFMSVRSTRGYKQRAARWLSDRHPVKGTVAPRCGWTTRHAASEPRQPPPLLLVFKIAFAFYVIMINLITVLFKQYYD